MALSQLLTGPQRASDAATIQQRGGKDGEGMVSELNARYYENAYRGRIYTCTAFVATPVIFSTAAGTGGPVLWNPPGSGVNIVLLKVGYGTTVAGGTACAIGVTGAGGQVLAPTATSAIDVAVKNMLVGGPVSQIVAYEIGTPINAGTFFMTYGSISTAAVSVNLGTPTWADFEGSIIAGPSKWLSCGSVTATSTGTFHVSAMWAEVPI